ncbi:hypothetical protein ACQ7B2_32025, partial [Escherichia coli]
LRIALQSCGECAILGSVTTVQFRKDRESNPVRFPTGKVPEITIYFWVIKILTTGMGETTSDFLNHRINPIIAVTCTGVV